MLTSSQNTVDVDMQEWDLTYEVKTFDSTTTADGGWEDETAAIKKITGSVKFFFDSSKSPNGVLGMAPGATPALQLFVNQPANTSFAGTALIKNWANKVAVSGGFIITAAFVNKGVWTIPA